MEFDIANHIVDIILAAIFFSCAATGLVKGLVEMITSAVSAVIAFFAAKAYAPRISGVIYEKYIREKLIEKATVKIGELTASGTEPLNISLPDSIVSMAQKAGVNLEAAFSDAIGQGAPAQAAQKFVSLIEEPFVIPAIEFALFVIGVLIVYAVLRLLTLPLCALVKLPVLKEVNKTAGLILGVVKGLFAVFCIAAVALIAASMFDGTAFANAVNNSYAAGVVSNIING